ncbi:hypothetical protein CLJ1_4107 [Pseudomonas paraeruginosa]|nr:hypothetical protein CLJ1_4107 [Pseudomonas aeruginosa]
MFDRHKVPRSADASSRSAGLLPSTLQRGCHGGIPTFVLRCPASMDPGAGITHAGAPAWAIG